MSSDTPEPLAAILAEMRDERIVRLDDGDATRLVLRNLADRIEEAVQRFVADDCAKCAHYHAATISLKDALDLANTIANHGITANDLGDKASAAIYALCHEVRTVRREDAEIKQEVQRLRRELLNHRNAPVNAAALRESIETMRRYAMLPQEQLSLSLLQRTIHEKCDAALAALARNCDRFATAEEAYAAWQASPQLTPICDWLFATAEGGDHA